MWPDKLNDEQLKWYSNFCNQIGGDVRKRMNVAMTVLGLDAVQMTDGDPPPIGAVIHEYVSRCGRPQLKSSPIANPLLMPYTRLTTNEIAVFHEHVRKTADYFVQSLMRKVLESKMSAERFLFRKDFDVVPGTDGSMLCYGLAGWDHKASYLPDEVVRGYVDGWKQFHQK